MPRNDKKKNRSTSIENPIDLDHHLPSLIVTLGGRLGLHSLRHATRHFDMGIRQWRIIHILGCDGPSTINEVAARIAMDQGGTSRSIVKLEKSGLIIRKSDEGDRRLSRITLSPGGVKIHNDMVKFSHIREKKLMARLSKKEQRELVRMLTFISEDINEMLNDDWIPNSSEL